MSSVTLASRMRRAMLVLAVVAMVVVMIAFSAAPAMAKPVITHPIFNNDLGLAASFNNNSGLAGFNHVVQPGETLSGIAAELGTTTEDLRAANDLPNPHLIFPGQVLRH